MYEDFYTPGLPSYKNVNPQTPARPLTYSKIRETPKADCVGRPRSLLRQPADRNDAAVSLLLL